MGNRFANADNLSNLFRDGTFELIQSDGESPFWKFSGIDLVQTPVNTNYVRFVSDETLDRGVSSYLEVLLADDDQGQINYSFATSTGILDFNRPLGPGERRSIAGGYQNDTETLITKGLYTLALSVLVEEGSAEFTLEFQGSSNADGINLTEVENGITQQVTAESGYQRVAFNFFLGQRINQVSVRVRRTDDTGLVRMRITGLTLTPGVYSDVAYLPCPFKSAIPKDAIVLSIGETCPTGFEELGDGGLSPLAEWSQNNSNSRGRRGNFPRNSAAQTGTERHTADEVDAEPSVADSVNYPTEENLKVLAEQGSPPSNPQAFPAPTVDLPGGPDGIPEHSHVLSDAGTRPVSWPMLLCKRL